MQNGETELSQRDQFTQLLDHFEVLIGQDDAGSSQCMRLHHREEIRTLEEIDVGIAIDLLTESLDHGEDLTALW